jgi:hypothetical protein
MKNKISCMFLFVIYLCFTFSRTEKVNIIDFKEKLVNDWDQIKSNLTNNFNQMNKGWKNFISSNFNKYIRDDNNNQAENEDEDEDHPCEKKTSMIIKHLIDGTPLPPEMDDFNKIAIYSGSGINDLGDYSSCKKIEAFSYYTILFDVNFGVYNLSLGTALCYYKECDIEYMNKAKSDIILFLNTTNGWNLTEDSFKIVDPDQKNNDYRNRMWVGFLVSLSLLGLLIILSYNLF